MVLVLLKLQLRECGEGTLVTEIFLAVTEVLALFLENSVFLSLVFVEQGVPGGPPVTQLTLQPSLLVLRRLVRVEVGQVVGPVLAVLAVEDIFTRVNLFVVSQPQSLVDKAGPALTKQTLDSFSSPSLVISALVMSLCLGTAVRLIRETGKASNLHHPPWLGFIFVFFEVDLHGVTEETFVVALTAGVFLDVLVDSLSMNMQGDLEVGAEVTLIALKLILATSLTSRW